jgi:hypothetical protein
LDAAGLVEALGFLGLDITKEVEDLKKIRPGGAVVLQVERNGVLGYLAFRLD